MNTSGKHKAHSHISTPIGILKVCYFGNSQPRVNLHIVQIHTQCDHVDNGYSHEQIYIRVKIYIYANTLLMCKFDYENASYVRRKRKNVLNRLIY